MNEKRAVTCYTIPLVSTSHVTEDDCCEYIENETNLLIFRAKNEVGAGIFLHIDEDTEIPEYYSESFRKLYNWAIEEGYGFIRLTPDGDVIEDDRLDVNNW